jgi:hypothetical protein
MSAMLRDVTPCRLTQQALQVSSRQQEANLSVTLALPLANSQLLLRLYEACFPEPYSVVAAYFLLVSDSPFYLDDGGNTFHRNNGILSAHTSLQPMIQEVSPFK